MKHFVILTIGVFVFATLVSFGQEESEKVDVLWGATQEESKKSTLEEIVGNDETGIYAVKSNEKGLYGKSSSIMIEHYNNQLDQTKSVVMELPYEKEERAFEFIVQLDNELFLFSSVRDKKQKRKFLFAQGIDKKSLQLNDNLKKITEIEGKSNSWRFNYKMSRDSTKLLIYSNIGWDRGKNEQFNIQVFDKELNQLWEKNVTLSHKEELYELEDFDINNNGDVYLLSLIYQKMRKEKRKGDPNYQHQILSYFNNGNESKEYTVKIEGKFITDMKIGINKMHDLICSGFYSEVGTYSIRGSYFIKIDGNTREITRKNFKEFDIDFVTRNMTEKEKAKVEKKDKNEKNVELYKYDLNQIILRDDGSTVLVGEQYFVHLVKDNNASGVSTTVYQYNYLDIIVVSISPNGDIEWAEKICKKQVSENDKGFFSSYAMSVVKDKLYFIFNGDSKYVSCDGSNSIYNSIQSNQSEVVLVGLGREGKHTREALFSIRVAGIKTRPKVCKQISEDEMILFGQRKKTHQFVKITFKE